MIGVGRAAKRAGAKRLMRSGPRHATYAVSDVNRRPVIVVEPDSIAWRKRHLARRVRFGAPLRPRATVDKTVPYKAPIAVEMALHPEQGAALAPSTASRASIRADWSGLGRYVAATFAIGLAVGAMMAPSPLATPDRAVSIELIELSALQGALPASGATFSRSIAAASAPAAVWDQGALDRSAIAEAFVPARSAVARPAFSLLGARLPAASDDTIGPDAGFASGGAGLAAPAKLAAFATAAPVKLGIAPSTMAQPTARTLAASVGEAAAASPSGRALGAVDPRTVIDLRKHAGSLAKVRLLVRPPPGEAKVSAKPLLEAAGLPFEAMPAPPFRSARTMVQYFDSRDAPAAEALAKAFDGDLMNLTRFNPPPPDRRVEVLLGE